MEKIKLVIWDLDETFWKGTLSEEGVEPISENISLIKALTDRGIINSIVSKNDFDKTKQKLIELEVWDYFVFPAIAWQPKGMLIKEVISACQLRDVNVLFLDDNHLNLEEAKFYNANLQVKSPDFIQNILSHPSFIGKDDKEHSRLKQYKILEDKAIAKSNYESNIDFLRSSEIKVQITHDLVPFKDRVLELIERTNQLNFTKIRSTPLELDILLQNPKWENGLIKVTDKYGDYDFVGFYSYDKEAHSLLHFVFSCRILNLGIPQYIFEKLNMPHLTIVPEVAEGLNGESPVWVEEIDFQFEDSSPSISPKNVDVIKALYKGGCEYDQLLFLLKNNNINFINELNYNTEENVPTFPYHTETILDAYRLSDDLKSKLIQDPLLIFVDKQYYQTKLFDKNFDCFIYNTRMDYTQFMYLHRREKYKVQHGSFGNDYTNKTHHAKILKKLQKRGVPKISQAYFDEFSKEFECLGKITSVQFIKNLHEIRRLIPQKIPIILINQPELREEETPYADEMYERYKIMNAALEQFISEASNVHLLDVRKVIDHHSKLESDISHFKRKYYRQLSQDLLLLLHHVLPKKVNPSIGLKSLVLDFGMSIVLRTKELKQKVFNKR
jgi:FkbH-like protein